jgi:hypothetical protein
MAVAGGGTYIFFDRGPAWVVLGVTVFWGLMLLLTVTWVVLRSTTGLLRLRRGESFSNYRTWTV